MEIKFLIVFLFSPQCMKVLREDYKFVLAFENSLCTDYVSEKLYTALENGVVPVVYGEADYRAYAPSYSYVNARDFGSPKELAEYLWLLHQNDHPVPELFLVESRLHGGQVPHRRMVQLVPDATQTHRVAGLFRRPAMVGRGSHLHLQLSLQSHRQQQSRAGGVQFTPLIKCRRDVVRVETIQKLFLKFKFQSKETNLMRVICLLQPHCCSI
jgi:hypothetical protein